MPATTVTGTAIDAAGNEAATPRFSVVIPAYNEERYLPRLIDTIDAARASYGRPEAVEVVVADNQSTDNTAAIAAARGCRVVSVEKRVIAAARNRGARAARGEILCFIDADARIHPETFRAIDEALATGRVVAGATGVRLERLSAGIAAAYLMIVPLVWLTNIDTGLVFCRREDFEAVGGYDEKLRIAEDVAFPWALKRLGRPRGQKLVRLRQNKAIGSLRKFDEYGDWHYVTMLPRSLWLFLFGRGSFNEWIDRYWYRPNR
jgi:glycosyltransferase involved in cell wall biosynthesis